LKGKEIPFYIFKWGPEFDFYKNIHTMSAIGQIKCLSGNYKRLKELRFIPSTLPDICHTLYSHMTTAGGDCVLCESYVRHINPFMNFNKEAILDEKTIKEIIEAAKIKKD
jgi:hypothetical protein